MAEAGKAFATSGNSSHTSSTNRSGQPSGTSSTIHSCFKAGQVDRWWRDWHLDSGAHLAGLAYREYARTSGQRKLVLQSHVLPGCEQYNLRQTSCRTGRCHSGTFRAGYRCCGLGCGSVLPSPLGWRGDGCLRNRADAGHWFLLGPQSLCPRGHELKACTSRFPACKRRRDCDGPDGADDYCGGKTPHGHQRSWQRCFLGLPNYHHSGQAPLRPKVQSGSRCLQHRKPHCSDASKQGGTHRERYHRYRGHVPTGSGTGQPVRQPALK